MPALVMWAFIHFKRDFLFGINDFGALFGRLFGLIQVFMVTAVFKTTVTTDAGGLTVGRR
jgi:hypothetical protein